MPDDNLTIEFGVKGIQDVLKGFEKVERASTRAGGNGPSYASGPFQRQAQLRSQMASALKDGNEAAVRDIHLAQKRNSQQIHRTGQSDFSKRLSTFARSSRFGAEGLQPLVGAGLDLLGAGEAGPVGLLAVGLMEAGKAAKKFADDASSAANAFARTGQQAGASPGETGLVRTLAQGLGIDPNSVAGAAEGLSSAIDPRSRNPFALAAAQKAGLNITPPQLGGDPDLTHNLTKALDYLHYDKSNADALQTARNLGLTQFLGVRNLKDGDYESLKKAGLLSGGAQGGLIGSGAAYDASKARVDAAVSQAVAPAQRGVLNSATAFNNTAAQTIRDASDPNIRGNIAASTSQNYARGGGVYGPSFASASPRAQAAYQASLDKHTEALHRHATAIERQSNRGQITIPGEYGNVTREGALPSGIGGPALLHALKHDMAAIRLSTF